MGYMTARGFIDAPTGTQQFNAQQAAQQAQYDAQQNELNQRLAMAQLQDATARRGQDIGLATQGTYSDRAANAQKLAEMQMAPAMSAAQLQQRQYDDRRADTSLQRDLMEAMRPQIMGAVQGGGAGAPMDLEQAIAIASNSWGDYISGKRQSESNERARQEQGMLTLIQALISSEDPTQRATGQRLAGEMMSQRAGVNFGGMAQAGAPIGTGVGDGVPSTQMDNPFAVDPNKLKRDQAIYDQRVAMERYSQLVQSPNIQEAIGSIDTAAADTGRGWGTPDNEIVSVMNRVDELMSAMRAMGASPEEMDRMYKAQLQSIVDQGTADSDVIRYIREILGQTGWTDAFGDAFFNDAMPITAASRAIQRRME